MDLGRATIPLAALALVVACAGCATHRGSLNASPSTQSPSASLLSGPPASGTGLSTVLSEVDPNGTVSLTTALQAFSLVVGPLPGVTPPAGPVGQVADGTFAVRWVLGYWRQLSTAQRTAIRRYLPEVGRETSAGSDSNAWLTGYEENTPPPAGPYQAAAEAASAEIAGEIGHPLGIPISVVINPTQVITTPPDYAYTYVYDSTGGFSGKAARCVISVEPYLYESKDASLVADSMDHEAFHCFQGADYPSLSKYNSAPDWLIEGSAEWAGQTLYPSATQADGWWLAYLGLIDAPLFSRSYSAIGFYAHMAESGIDPWHTFDAMWNAPSSAAAYQVATNDTFKLTWASSLTRIKPFGQGWSTTGPAIPNVVYAPPVKVLGVNQSISSTVAPYTNAIVRVITTANALQISASTPWSRLHDSTVDDVNGLNTANDQYCIRNCDSTPFLASLPRLDLGNIWVAVTGDAAGASYTIKAFNGAPCLVGNWITTNWEGTTTGGSFGGGAGIRFVITSKLAFIDFTGMQPLGEDGFVLAGQETAALSYSQFASGTSGTLSLEGVGGDVTGRFIPPYGDGSPISGGQSESPVDGAAGVWTCSATNMSMHLSNSTGSLDIAFVPAP
jgi:hypothetical protein